MARYEHLPRKGLHKAGLDRWRNTATGQQ